MRDGSTVKAQLWDTAGQEKYRAITVAHYRRVLGALIVYDITRRQTFDSCRYWLDSLKASAEQEVHIMLVGNKLDLVIEDPKQRQVETEEGTRLAAQTENMRFMETSVVTQENVKNAFEILL
mmetsp:Transcript_1544/g.1040  ORF Transcript_1544/g.1040 Transcript_1544/m.1040 type:complete len:122 (+) Transcript_1544:199-564(+)